LFCLFKDDKNSTDRKIPLNGNAIQFPRRHSAVSSTGQPVPSIISRSSTFRKHFRPASLQVRDYRKTSCKKIFLLKIKKTFFSKVFEDNNQTHAPQVESCLIPTAESDLPLLIEEYHQLCRIVMLHQLEDVREMVKIHF
jgi:hypothetical protein